MKENRKYFKPTISINVSQKKILIPMKLSLRVLKFLTN